MIKVIKSCECCPMAHHEHDYCRLDMEIHKGDALVHTLNYGGVPVNCPLRKEDYLLTLGETE